MLLAINDSFFEKADSSLFPIKDFKIHNRSIGRSEERLWNLYYLSFKVLKLAKMFKRAL